MFSGFAISLKVPSVFTVKNSLIRLSIWVPASDLSLKAYLISTLSTFSLEESLFNSSSISSIFFSLYTLADLYALRAVIKLETTSSG